MPILRGPWARVIVPTMLFTLLAVGACAADPGEPPPAARQTSRATATSHPAAPAPARADRVLVVSVDGLNPDALARLGRRGAPNLHAIRDLGAATDQARTAVELTRTLPNHAGMVTGRRVEAARGGHGVQVNEDDGGATVADLAGHPVGSMFDVAHEAAVRTALVASKDKLRLLGRSWAGSLDTFSLEPDSPSVVAAALRALDAGDRSLVLAHLARPDQVGHRAGFMSDAYLTAVEQVDGALEPVLARLAEQPGDMALILTADHGGDAGGHGDPSDPDHFTVPFYLVSPGIAPGSDLAAMAGEPAQPGQQPSYDGPQPVRNADVASAATGLLGLPRVPGSEFRTVRRALNQREPLIRSGP